MRKTSKKYHYLLITIKVIIIVMFIIVTIRGMKETYFHWDMSGAKENGSLSFLEIGLIYSHFRPILIMLLPIIGIFLNRKIGWILIMSYFYFVITRAIYSTINSVYEETFSIIYLVVAIGLYVPFIIFLNVKKIRENIYNIQKSAIIKYNIIATIIGISITLIII